MTPPNSFRCALASNAGGKGSPVVAQLRLYGRSYCHLCDDMRAALVPLEATFGFTVEVVDIDLQGDAALLVKYDELVPLLAGRKRDGSELEICHYFLDLAALQAYFACDDRDG